MMKPFSCTLLTMMVVAKAFSQSDALAAQQDTVVSYHETVTADGVSKNDLFIRARDWKSNNCKSLKIQDNETGELSGSCSMEGDVTVRFLGAHTALATFDFVISIWVKDGVYNYLLTNIDNIKVNATATNGVFGMLYVSKHCHAKEIAISQAKLDEAYQSLKDGFDKNEKVLAGFIKSSMAKQ